MTGAWECRFGFTVEKHQLRNVLLLLVLYVSCVGLIGISGDPTRDRIQYGPALTRGSFSGMPVAILIAGNAHDRAAVRSYVNNPGNRLQNVHLVEVGSEEDAMAAMGASSTYIGALSLHSTSNITLLYQEVPI